MLPVNSRFGIIAQHNKTWRGRIVRPSARAWRARIPHGIVGSNPTPSAFKSPRDNWAFFLDNQHKRQAAQLNCRFWYNTLDIQRETLNEILN